MLKEDRRLAQKAIHHTQQTYYRWLIPRHTRGRKRFKVSLIYKAGTYLKNRVEHITQVIKCSPSEQNPKSDNTYTKNCGTDLQSSTKGTEKGRSEI